jgi:hypothetical protein
MKFKTPAPRQDAAERDDVQLTVNRCPFCHTNVAQDTAQVVCKGCLARHHTACWDESHECSACGHGLRMAADTTPRAQSRKRLDHSWMAVAAGAVAFLLSLGVLTAKNSELRADARAADSQQMLVDLGDQLDDTLDMALSIEGCHAIKALVSTPNAPSALAKLESFKANCAKQIAEKGAHDLKPKELRYIQRELDAGSPGIQLRVVQSVLGLDDAAWAERLGVTQLDLVRYDTGIPVPSRCTLVAGLMLREWYTNLRTGL